MKKIFCTLLAVLGLNNLLAGTAQAEPVDFAIDVRHTMVMFEYTHQGFTFIRGRWNVAKESTVQIDKEAQKGKADIIIDVTSLNTGYGVLDKHIISPEVFDTPKYPTAHFVSSQFNFDGDKVTGISGMLTLMGKDYPITFKARQYKCGINPFNKKLLCGGEFETMIDREVMGITFALNGAHPTKEVRLLIAVEGAQR